MWLSLIVRVEIFSLILLLYGLLITTLWKREGNVLWDNKDQKWSGFGASLPLLQISPHF